MEACELGDASVDVIVLLSSLNTTMRVGSRIPHHDCFL